ncbi:unnamed protein product [Durusdinium trenchii]|uniref:EF-hand domain-containing protein n=1 Tax=Durusdinium trenchii TaxID=1381693 RepID=A0ABP0L2G7_9DINO
MSNSNLACPEEKGVESPRNSLSTQPGRLFGDAAAGEAAAAASRRGWELELGEMIEAKHQAVMEKIDQQCKLLELFLSSRRPSQGPGAFKELMDSRTPATSSKELTGSRRPSQFSKNGIDSKELQPKENSRRPSQFSKGTNSKEDSRRPSQSGSTGPQEVTESETLGQIGESKEVPARPSQGSQDNEASRSSKASNTSAFSAHRGGQKVPTKNSFTPQLFKTFSQNDMTKRKKAHAASARRSLSMGESLNLQLEPEPSRVQNMVRHPGFDLFFTVVVITNSIFIGVELQLSVAHPKEDFLAVSIIQYLYTLLFTGELVMRVVAEGRHFLCGEDWSWGWLDLFIVLFSLWETVLGIIYYFAQAEGQQGMLSGFSSLKAFRIIRITRLVKAVRLVRILRFVMAFRMLISSILHTLKSLFWALMLLLLIIYVFAVLFTQAVNDHLCDAEVPNPLVGDERDEALKYFGSLPFTMLSLFMSISGGVSWELVIRPLQEISATWVVIYLFYVAFTYFAVLNVVTAVFCQSAIEGAQNDHASKVHAILANKEAHLEKINTLFSKFGAEGGVITFEQFQRQLKAAEVREYFQTLGLDVWDAWSFFKLLDEDGGGEVEVEEFLMGCLRLRGQATAMDVGKIINDQTWLIKNQGKFQAYVEVELAQLKEYLALIAGENVGSDEHIGLIFGDHTFGVSRKFTNEDVPENTPSGLRIDYQFERTTSP